MRLVIFDRDEVLTLLRGRRFCVYSTACIGPRRRWRRFRSVPDRIDYCDLAILRSRSLDSDFLRSLGSDFCFRLFFRCPSEFWPETQLRLHVSRIMGPRELPTPHNAGSAQQGRDPRSGPQILLDWSSLISVSSIKFSTSFF
jgi:hypothetical protein